MFLLEVNFQQFIINAFNFIIPALIVFGVTFYLMSTFMKEQRKLRILDLKKEHLKEITPVKLQAYERLTLFLDRISPENLVLRLSKSGQSANQLRHELIQNITNEYNHNISQQIYISDESWKMIKAVKEQMLNLIEVCYRDCNEMESGPGLGKKILTRLMAEESNPTQRAIELLKKEIEIAI